MKIYIQQNGQSSGPFTVPELQDKIYSGEVLRSVPACAEGGTDWVPLNTLLESSGGSPPLLASAPAAFPRAQLIDPKERTALIWLYAASAPVWIVLIIWTVFSFGIPLVFFGIGWMFNAFGKMWFAAYLKTNAIRVSETQLPELNRAVENCCQQLGMERPEVYVLQHNVWNAFATKIFGSRMVVLFSGAVDSILLKGDLEQLTWVVGHELGHHWAGHLNISQALARLGGWLIWVGLWHSRRCEFTCDRVGLYCVGNLKSCQLALMNLTVGAQLANKVNPDAALAQWQQHRNEFFVQYRTLYSTHPHLLARLERLNAAAQEFGLAR